MKTFLVFVAAALAFGPAAFAQTAKPATPEPTTARESVPHALPDPTSSCGSKESTFHVEAAPQSATVPGPDAATARIYLIQDSGQAPGTEACFHLGCITTKAAVDGAWVGANQGGSWFSFTLPPGEHHMCVSWQSKLRTESSHYAFARFSVLAGYVYYYRVRIWGPSDAQAKLDLDLLNMDEGRYLVLNNTQSVSREEK